MKLQEKPFVDNWPDVCGWVQYFDVYGTQWRRENNDFTYSFYREGEGAFILDGHLVKKGLRGRGISYIHHAYLDQQSFEE